MCRKCRLANASNTMQEQAPHTAALLQLLS
jgi:hypothetical protein